MKHLTLIFAVAILHSVCLMQGAPTSFAKAKQDDEATMSPRPQNVRVKPQVQQRGTIVGHAIGATATDGQEDHAEARKSGAAKTTKGRATQNLVPIVGPVIAHAKHDVATVANEKQAARNITAQVNQLVASRNPDKKTAQQLLTRITAHKKSVQNLQAQQRQGQAQTQDQSKLSFQVQDLMSQYNHAEVSLRKVAQNSGMKSR